MRSWVVQYGPKVEFSGLSAPESHCHAGPDLCSLRRARMMMRPTEAAPIGRRKFDQRQTSACTQCLPCWSHFGTILHPLTSRTLGDRFVAPLLMTPGRTVADAPTIPVTPTPNANRAGNRNVRMRISSEWSGCEPGSRRAAGTNGLLLYRLHCGAEIQNRPLRSSKPATRLGNRPVPHPPAILHFPYLAQI